jgi:Carboxypeptidase regulatory-like domain/TonB dependent receptor
MRTKLETVMNRIGQCGRAIQNRGKRSAALLALSVLFISPVFAQLTTADILGTVTDPSGAVVPNATVTITNLGTNEQRTAQTSGSGDYAFTLLPVGHYSVTVKAPGFQSSVTKDLSIEAGDRARNDVHLTAGSEATTVEVQATTPLLQSDSATVSSTVTAQAVQDLPLNGRNFVQLVQIVPGANEGPGNGLTSGARPDDRRQTASFSVNGQDDTLNNYTIDGIDDNERIIGTIGVRPVVEGIQEITVQTNNYTAEVGRTAGGVVSIVTRAGTNQFHGTAYEYFRNDIFDARNVLQTTGKKPELRQNQFGGSIGGPILKDRTFFFGDYEGLRQVIGQTYTKTTLTQEQYNDVHSLNGGSPQALINAGNGTQGLPVDPIALAYLSLYPAPNAGAPGALTNNYITSPNKTQTSNSFDIRIDHRFSANNVFFGRYDYNKVDTFIPPGLGVDPATGLQISGGQFDFDGPATDTAQQYGFGFTHIFSPSLLVDLRAAFTRINNLSLPLNYSGSKGADFIVQGSNPGTFAPNLNNQSLNLTPIGFPGLSDIGDGSFVPLQDIDNTFQYTGNVSWTKGSHNVKFGASLIRRQARNLQSSYIAGQYTFGLNTDASAPAGTTFTPTQQQNNGIASTLTGAFSNAQRVVDINTPDYRTWEPSFFVQDSWKISPKLTVLYGVRYDVFTPFTEAHNHLSNFDFFSALKDTPATVGRELKIAGVNGVDGHAGIEIDYTNVAPRLGFAYSVTPQTIIRGGFGISYFPGNYTSNAALKNVPFQSTYQPNCQSSLAVRIEIAVQGRNTGNPDCATIGGASTTFDQGLPLPAAPDISNLQTLTPLSFRSQNVDFKSGVIYQYNLQAERQFGATVATIGYVGNLGRHLPETVNDMNQPAPYSTNPNSPFFGPGPRRLAAQFPNGNLAGVGEVLSEGISNYNGLQTSLLRRFSKGLSFDANYTWAKGLADNNGYSQQGGQEGFSNADPFHIRQIDYGIAENDIQNRFALSLNYQIQYGNNFTGLKRQALAGWSFNTIAVWQTGKPFSILNGGGNNDNTSYVDPITGKTVTESFNNRAVPNNNGGQDRPNQIGKARGNRSLHQFFNTAAFAPQPTGTIGTARRNSLFGPNYRHVDVSLFKDFPLTEQFHLQFRAESYNISNTPSYIIKLGSANNQLGNPAFGTVTDFDPNYTPRLYQFALKLQF